MSKDKKAPTSLMEMLEADGADMIGRRVEDALVRMAVPMFSAGSYAPHVAPPIPNPPIGWSVERVAAAVETVWGKKLDVSWTGKRFDVEGFPQCSVTFDALAQFAAAVGTKSINLAGDVEYDGADTFDSGTPLVRLEITP